MRWLVDASHARHSGILTHHLGMLPALDELLDGDRCTVLASPVLARALDGRLRSCTVEVLAADPGLGRFLSLNRRVRRRIRSLRPAAVLCGQYAPVGEGAPYVLRMTDAHLVAHAERRRLLRFYSPAQRLGWRVKLWAFARSLSRAAGVLCATNAVKDQLLGAHPRLDPERVHVAHYGPSGVVDPAVRHPGARGRRLLTMHVSPRKNVETIFEALTLPELEGWTLTVMGDVERPRDRYARFLARRIRALGLERRVRSVGYIHDRDRVLACMLEHDVLVCPSRIESWSHTVIEGIGIGMPTVASAIACHHEVAGDGAWLIPCDDPAALARAVRRASAADRPAQRRIARGLEISRGYSWREYAAGALRALRAAARE